MDEYFVPKKMKPVGDLFDKYRTLFKAPQATVEKEFLIVVTEVTGYKLALGQISYTVSTRTISLRVPSIMKSELKFHYSKILQTLENRLGVDGSPKVII